MKERIERISREQVRERSLGQVGDPGEEGKEVPGLHALLLSASEGTIRRSASRAHRSTILST